MIQERKLKLPEVLGRVPVSRATLYRWIGNGQFPRPYQLNGPGSTVVWLESEVEAWEANALATSATPPRPGGRPVIVTK